MDFTPGFLDFCLAIHQLYIILWVHQGFAGENRYGPHPYISGPIYAAEYNGYPGTVADLGAVMGEDEEGSPSHVDVGGTLGARFDPSKL